MSSCAGCGNRLHAKSKVKCKICAKEFHHNCARLAESDLANINNCNLLWTCKECTSKMFQKTSNADPLPTKGNCNEPTLNDVIDLIKELRNDQKESIRSIGLLQDETAEIRKIMDKINDDLNDKENKINNIESNVINLKQENEELKEKLNILDQSVRMNCLEITGIPECGKGENVFVTAQIVCSCIGFKLENSMIDSCYRRRENVNKLNQAKTIIIKFLKNSDKQELMKCRKVKRDFSTKYFKDTSLAQYVKNHEIIYINDFLTIQNKILLHKAKQFKKENNYKFVWTKNGLIFMRKEESSRIINVTSTKMLKDAL